MLSSNSLSAYRPIFCCKNYNFQYGAILLTKAVLYWKKNLVMAKHPSQKRTGSARPFGLPELPEKPLRSRKSFGMKFELISSQILWYDPYGTYIRKVWISNRGFESGFFAGYMLNYKIPPKSPINSKKNIYIFIRIFWLFSTILTYKFQGEKKDWKTILDLFLIFYLCINPHNPWGEGAVRPPPSLSS